MTGVFDTVAAGGALPLRCGDAPLQKKEPLSLARKHGNVTMFSGMTALSYLYSVEFSTVNVATF